MNVFLRTILISMLLLASPLRGALAGIGDGADASQQTIAETVQKALEMLDDAGFDGCSGASEPIEQPEEADEAVIEFERHARLEGLSPAHVPFDEAGPQCATAQATPPPNSI